AHDGLRAGVEMGARERSAAERVRPAPEHAVGPEERRRERLQALVRLAPEHLLERRLRAGLAGAEELRQAPVAGEAEELDLDVRLREALPDARVAERAARRRVGADEADELGEAPPDLPLEGERPHRPALVGDDAHRDRPAGARRADDAVR